jgi:hypothetical protein
MPRQSDDEASRLPSDSDNVTLPTDRRKCGAERVTFSSKGSSSVSSPVKEKIFEKQGRAQEQSSLCAAHVTAIGYRPALRYPFSREGSNSIPSHVKPFRAAQSQHISYGDEDECEVIAEYVNNHQGAMDVHDIVDDIYRHSKNLCTRAAR